MKNSLALLVVLATISASIASPRASGDPSTSPIAVALPVNHVYAPFGFDSNDNIEVVVKGYLPNLCYRAPNTHVQVADQTIQIQVTALYPSLSEHVLCAQVMLPFLEVAQVGVLDQGDYNVVINPSESHPALAAIQISEATSSAIDNNVYANVTSVEKVPGTRTVLLKGSNPVNCYGLAQIKYVTNGKDTYSVLPILKQVSPNCENVTTPFTYSWDVPSDLSAIEDEPLLHVRVMNGKSINVLFDETE
jgi:hypothetical protein